MTCCVAIGNEVYPQEQSFQIQEEQSLKKVSVLIEVELNIETVDNEGQSALLNTKDIAVLYDIVN